MEISHPKSSFNFIYCKSVLLNTMGNSVMEVFSIKKIHWRHNYHQQDNSQKIVVFVAYKLYEMHAACNIRM